MQYAICNIPIYRVVHSSYDLPVISSEDVLKQQATDVALIEFIFILYVSIQLHASKY